MCVCVCVCVWWNWKGQLSKALGVSFCTAFPVASVCVRLFVILWTVAHQPPRSMRFSRQEYWSGLPCLLLDPLREETDPAATRVLCLRVGPALESWPVCDDRTLGIKSHHKHWLQSSCPHCPLELLAKSQKLPFFQFVFHFPYSQRNIERSHPKAVEGEDRDDFGAFITGQCSCHDIKLG